MEQNVTSEEKLLKIIRKKDPFPAEKSSKNFVNKENKEKNFVRNLNFFLSMVVFFLIGYIGVQFYFQTQKEHPGVKNDGVVEETSRTAGFQQERDLKEFEEYEGTFLARDIFQHPWEKEVEERGAPPEEKIDFQTKLKIVGIVLDDNPEAIIEDLSTRQTFFLSEGENIIGLKIKKIQEDRVIFDYNGEEIELVQ